MPENIKTEEKERGTKKRVRRRDQYQVEKSVSRGPTARDSHQSLLTSSFSGIFRLLCYLYSLNRVKFSC